MNEQDISAEEAAINRAIDILESAEVAGTVLDAGEHIALAAAWAQVALAIAEHNRVVSAFALAEAGRAFIKNPSPENYALFQVSAEQYEELG